MYVLDSHKLVYVAHPRTASVATGSLLVSLGARKVGSHHQVGPIPEGYTVATTVRNHWDMLASYYAKDNPDLDFGPYLKEVIVTQDYFRPSRLYPHTDIAGVVLRYESLQRQLYELIDDRATLSRDNVSLYVHPPWTKGLRAWVYDRYQDEIEALGYGTP